MFPRAISLLHKVQEVLALEKRTITMRGTTSAKFVFDYFVKPHPTYKVFPNKAIGVALIELPGQFEKFLDGSSRRDLRNKRNRALREGYGFRLIRSLDYQEQILRVNRSAEFRQGQEMPRNYMDPEKVEEYLTRNPEFHAVFNRDGELCAYMHVLLYGEICVMSRILGHVDFVKDGIMYLLISELVKELIGSHPEVKYLMYDTMFGAKPGLRYFKERCGFLPYRVKWRWETVAQGLEYGPTGHSEPA